MKRILTALLVTFIAAGCVEDSIDNTIEPVDKLIPIAIGATVDYSNPDITKTSISGLTPTWNSGDAISFYTFDDYGLTNDNVKLTLSSGAGTKNAVFKGNVNSYGSAKMIAIYPYADYGSNVNSFSFSIKDQKYDGDFTAESSFSDFGKFNFMIGPYAIEEGSTIGNITLTSFTGLVRFEVTSDMTDNVIVRDISVSCTDGNYPFTERIVNLGVTKWSDNAASIGFSYYPTNKISVTIDNGPGLSINSSSGTKYVQMVVFKSFISKYGSAKLNVNVSAKIGDRRARFVIDKGSVSSNYDFAAGQRTRISVPLTSSAISMYASTVKIGTNGGSFTAPTFVGSGIEYGETQWADGSITGYSPGENHSYGSGDKTTVMDCWGDISAIKFSTLENITSIDLTMIGNTK